MTPVITNRQSKMQADMFDMIMPAKKASLLFRRVTKGQDAAAIVARSRFCRVAARKQPRLLASIILLCFWLMPPAQAQLECYVSDYGAVGNGQDFDTEAIQAAVADCNDGGTVIFEPDQIYLTGTIVLSGSVNIYLPEDSSIIAGTQVRPAS